MNQVQTEHFTSLIHKAFMQDMGITVAMAPPHVREEFAKVEAMILKVIDPTVTETFGDATEMTNVKLDLLMNMMMAATTASQILMGLADLIENSTRAARGVPEIDPVETVINAIFGGRKPN